MRFSHFTKRIKLALIFLLFLPCLLFADYQIKSDDIRVKTTDFSGNLSSADNTVQKALDTIDGLSISSISYPGAGIPLSTGSAWGTSITNNSANWNTAYSWGNHASAGYEASSNKVTSISGSSTDTQYPSAKLVYDQLAGKQATGEYLTGVTVDSPLSGAGTAASHLTVDLSSKQAASAALTSIAGLTWVSGSPLVKMTAAGTFGLDSTAYLTDYTIDGAHMDALFSGASGLLKKTGTATYTLDTNSYLTSLSGAVLTDQSTGQTIGDTDHRLTKLWATDITCTNAISGSVTGNAGTVTNATLTTALTNNGGAGTLTWPAAGATLTIPTGGGTLGSAAFTSSGDYLAVGATAADSAKLNGQSASYYQTALGYTPLNATGATTGATSQAQEFTNGVISNTVTGGTSTTSDLYLKTTSGVGTTGADMHFLVGNNGGTEALTILNSGNVGIGTTSPVQQLEVAYGNIRFDYVSDPSAPTATLVTDATGNIPVGTYKYNVVFVTPVGETSYAATFSNDVTVDSSHTKVNLTNIPIDTTGRTVSRKIYRAPSGWDRGYLLTTINDNVTTTYQDNIASPSPLISYQVNNTAGNFYSGSNWAFSLTNTGVVSFGKSISVPGNYSFCTSPLETFSYSGINVPHYGLTCAGHSYLSGYFGVDFFTSGGVRASITDTGLGIGTTSPAVKLELSKNSANTSTVQEMQRITTSSTGTVAAGFGNSITSYLEDASGNTPQIASQIATIWTDPTNASESSALTFSGVTSGGAITEWARVVGGNVGIGTTAPDRKLEINTGAATGGLRLTYNDANGSATTYSDMLIDSNGDLAITATGGDISFDNENITTSGTIKGGGYKSSDDTAGASTTTGGLTFKNGLYTSGSATVYEPALGNPASDGYVLSSTAAGVRSWVDVSGVGATALDDIGDPDAATSISTDDGENLTFLTAVDGENFLAIHQTAASVTATTHLLDLGYNADADTEADFILCRDDLDGTPAEMFKVEYNGDTTTAGNINAAALYTSSLNNGTSSNDITIDASGDDIWVVGGTNLQFGNSSTNAGAIYLRNGALGGDPLVTMQMSTNDFSVTTDTGDINLIPTGGDVNVTGAVVVDAAGVKISSDGDGALTLLGLGDGFDESLTVNLDDTENTAVVSSTTGVTKIDCGSIVLEGAFSSSDGTAGASATTGGITYKDGLYTSGTATEYATKALDNLASVAINTSLVSDTDNTDDLGSSAKAWKDLYLKGNISDNTVSQTATRIINRATPGVIEMFAGSSAPTGSLLCDGSAVSRTTYADLFTAIGTTWGTGDGSTTFNLPDFRGIFPKGAGTTNRAAGKDASGNYYAATLGAYSTDKFQSHWHDVKNGTNTNGLAAVSSGDDDSNYGFSDVSQASIADSVMKATTPLEGTAGAVRDGNTTEPQSAAVNFIIWY